MTVIFWLAEVVTVKLDPDTLLMVPIVPPAAGPDRALDPLPDPERPARGKPLLFFPLLLVLLLLVPLVVVVLVLVAPLEHPATAIAAIAAIPAVMTLARLRESIL